MRYRYRYFQRYDEALVKQLDSLHIKYEILDGISGRMSRRVVFDIYNTDKQYETRMAALKPFNLGEPFDDLEYSEADRRNAKLLRILPKRQCIDITNEDASFRPICQIKTLRGDYYTRHDEQVGDIRIAKEPSMKSSTAIWSISTSFSEYFTDKRVRALAEKEQLSGLIFRNVLLKGERISENLFQLLSDQVVERECFVPKKIHHCSVCGAEILEQHYQQPLKMDFSKFDPGHDFYMSGRFFGGSSGSAEPIYLVSQRFYQLLRQSRLSGGVNFDPVTDVSDK